MRRLGTQVGTQVGGVASNACHDIKANCSTYITSVNLSKGDATKVTSEILKWRRTHITKLVVCALHRTAQ